MTRSLVPILVVTALIGFSAVTLTAQSAAVDSVTSDSSSRAAIKPATAIDSTRTSRDPAFAWLSWRDLTAAITLRELDGPDDILKKSDIIKDRLDALMAEQIRLTSAMKEWTDRQGSFAIQIEVLDDLAKVQRGGDLQLQQRLHNMREGRRVAAQRVQGLTRSLSLLKVELTRLQDLLQEYNRAAENLRRQEDENR